MINKINSTLVSVFIFILTGYAQEKTHVISHNEVVIVTDPSKGNNSYKRWAKFPEESKSIRSIILNLIECPDKMRCADWDYVDRISASQKNDTTTYEIARMLTPYGGFFQKDWVFEWQGRY